MKFPRLLLLMLSIFIGLSSFMNRGSVTQTFTTAQPQQDDLKKGKIIMEQRCIKCHSLKVVNDHTQERWDKIFPKMIKKAKLTITEAELVKNYVGWKLKNE